MKIITLTDISIKELRLGFTDEGADITVLYSPVTDSGQELGPRWSDPIKGAAITGLINGRINQVLEVAATHIKQLEGI